MPRRSLPRKADRRRRRAPGARALRQHAFPPAGPGPCGKRRTGPRTGGRLGALPGCQRGTAPACRSRRRAPCERPDSDAVREEEFEQAGQRTWTTRSAGKTTPPRKVVIVPPLSALPERLTPRHAEVTTTLAPSVGSALLAQPLSSEDAAGGPRVHRSGACQSFCLSVRQGVTPLRLRRPPPSLEGGALS